MENPLVSVCMITYNHESYIHEAIKGVLIQKTNFPFELIIGEDCSTDNTRKIIREYETQYPEIIIAQYPETNRGMAKNFTTVIESARGKYIAFCEGDDYWTDPLKLQKQVDFLEINQDYGLVHTGYLNYYNNTGEKISPFLFGQSEIQGFVFEKLLIQNRIGTLTVVVWKKLIEESIVFHRLNALDVPFYDVFIWLYIANKCKVAFIEDITAEYRVLLDSASNKKDPVKKAYFLTEISRIEVFFITSFKVSQEIVDIVLSKANRRYLYLHFLMKAPRKILMNLFYLIKLKSITLNDLLFTVGAMIPFLHRIILNKIIEKNQQ